MILLLDTTTDYLGIGLWDGKLVPPKAGKLHTKTLKSSTNINKKIISIIDKFITQNTKYKIQNTDAVGIINGPGAFTGVRTGVTIANALSYALKIPIYSIDSLFAQIPPHVDKNIISLLSAAKKEVYYAKFKKGRRKGPIKILAISDIKDKIKKEDIVVGQIREEQKQKIKFKYKEINPKDRIKNLLQMILNKQIKPQKQIIPLYIKKPNVTINI